MVATMLTITVVGFGGDYNNNNSGSNNTPTTGYEVLRNDPHYRYENGTHYYLKDNGDYYYYSNGKWVLVKASNADSEAPATSDNFNCRFNFISKFEAASTVDSTSSATSEDHQLLTQLQQVQK